MRKWFGVLGAIAIGLVAGLGGPVHAAPAGSGTLAAVSTATLVVPVSYGANTCSLTISGTFSATIAAVPSMADGSTPGPTVPFISGTTTTLGPTAPGTYQVNVAQFQNLTLYWSSYSSGSALVTYNCGSGIARVPAGASAAPQNTSSPTVSATGCGVLSISGSFPYTLSDNTTGCAAATSPTNTPYQTVVASYSPVNDWKLGDTGTHGPFSNCPATFANSGSSATALTTPNPAPSTYCGSVSIDSTNNGSVEFDGNSQSDNLTIPAGTMPSPSANFSIVMSVQYTGYKNGSGTSTTPNFMVWDSSNHWNAGCDTMGRVNVYNGSNIGGGGSSNGCTGVPVLFGFVYTSSGPSEVLWVNGAPAGNGTQTIQAQNAAGGIGSGLAACGSGCQFAGRVANVWTTSSLLTQTDWEKLYFAWKCGGLAVGSCHV